MTGLVLGMLASYLYFGGLRKTIKGLSVAKKPRAKVAWSFRVRLTLLLCLMSCLDLSALVPFLFGFFGLRNVLVWRWS